MAEHETEKNEWTILLYMAGDNALAEHMVKALHDIDKLRLESFFNFFGGASPAGGSEEPKNADDLANEAFRQLPKFLEKVRLLAQFDPSGVGVPTQRFDVTAILRAMWEVKKAQQLRSRLAIQRSIFDFDFSGVSDSVREQIEKTRDSVRADHLWETNTGASETLARFIQWSFEAYPVSDHRMLILSGHGSGILHGSLMSDRQPGSAAGSDDGLTVPELKRALRDGLKGTGEVFDVIGMDACLMGMGELMVAVKDHAKYYVGAEGFEPLGGWPYRQLLETFLPFFGTATAEQVAHTIVDVYIDHYRPLTELTDWSVDQAVVRLRRDGKKTGTVEDVRLALENLAKELLPFFKEEKPTPQQKTVRDAVVLAHWRAQSYLDEEYVDLWDFCDQLTGELPKGNKLAVLHKKLNAVKTAVKNSAVSCHSGPAYQHSHGISIYFPWWGVAVDYSNLAKELSLGNWVSFLLQYVEKTRRESLPCGKGTGDKWAAHVNRLTNQLQALSEATKTLIRVLKALEEDPCGVREKLGKVPKNVVEAFKNSEVETRLQWLGEHEDTLSPEAARRFSRDLRLDLEKEVRRLQLDNPQISRAHTGIFIVDSDKALASGRPSRFTDVGGTRFTDVGGTRFTDVGGTRFTDVGGTRYGRSMGGSSMKNPPLEWERCPCHPPESLADLAKPEDDFGDAPAPGSGAVD